MHKCAAWGIPVLRMLDDQGRVIKINATKPIPIETKYFKGVILPMIRCEGKYDKYNTYKGHFEGTDRKFEIQFQGKIKYVPKGVLMLGGELTEKMQMGYWTRTLISILIGFSMAIKPDLKIGFGEDVQPNMQYERPHLVFPLLRILDRVVVTKPGETPPMLGQELPESDEDRNNRQSGKTDIQFDTECTYSFAFHSSFVDFANWSLCGFPGYGAIDIRTFFGKQSPQIVVYEFINDDNLNSTGANSKAHYMNQKRYLASMQLSYFPEDAHDKSEPAVLPDTIA